MKQVIKAKDPWRVSCRPTSRGVRILVGGRPTPFAPDPVKPARLKAVKASVEKRVIPLKQAEKAPPLFETITTEPVQFLYVAYFADLMCFSCEKCGETHKFTHPHNGHAFKCACGRKMEVVFKETSRTNSWVDQHECPYCHALNQRGGNSSGNRNCRACRKNYELRIPY